ncbi:MAG: PAS domain S-box protein [Geobacteraceae bacterium]|nr:PAS domain S-box protein [Geobacteraceae bacterium]
MKCVFTVDDNGRGMEEIRQFLRERGYSVTESSPETCAELRFTRFTVDRASLQVFWLTPDHRFIYVNDEACRSLGYTREELTSMSVGDVDMASPGPESDASIEYWRLLKKNGHGKLETFHRSRDGRVYPVEVHSNFLEFEGKEYSCCFVNDIGERKRIEEALRESEGKFRLLIETSPNAIIVIRGERIVYANPAATQVSGFSGEQLGCMEFWGFVHEDFREEIRGRIMARLQGQPISGRYEYKIICSNGEEKWMVAASVLMDYEGAPAILVTLADITEAKRTEEALRESEARLRLAMEMAKLVQWEFEGATGMFRFDDQFFALYGTSVAREGGMLMSAEPYVSKFIHPDDRADVIDVIQRFLPNNDRSSTGSMEHRIIRADGAERYIFVRWDIIRDQEGRMVRTRGAIQDITERKREEEKRKILEEQLHQAQKMEAVGQLAGGIAHDFNNILTAIMGFAEIMTMRMEQGNPFQHHVKQILAAAERATDLTRGLLAFSRKQVLRVRPIDLCEVVDGVKKMLCRLIPEDIDCRVRTAATAMTVMADKGQIEQVLMNLVTNARDAMPGGGLLRVETGLDIIDRDFVRMHGFGMPGAYAIISVEDNGCGMDEETREKIFDPFFTTKKVGKGTGLGLSIIYGIVKQHNGFITVDSSPGKGTVFCVYLPLADHENQCLPEIRRAGQAPGGAETILLVEDDDAVRALTREILEEAGYTVIETADGQEALDRFRERQANVDMLVTDVVMPNMDGKMLYEEIISMRPDMKVLFMSGYSTDILDGRGVADDGINLLTKPVMPSELLKKLREVLDAN